MTMPTFTADASLYRSGAHYRMARTVHDGSGARTVLPQLRRSTGFCMADCDYTTSDPLSNAACKFDCMEGGGDGGPSGPSEPRCRPSCGPSARGGASAHGADKSITEIAVIGLRRKIAEKMALFINF